MAETAATSDNGQESKRPQVPQSNLTPPDGSDGAAFAGTRKALAELGRTFLKFGRALRIDVAGAARRPAADKLRALCSAAFQRLREMDFSAGKVRAAELAARSTAIWSWVKLWRTPSAQGIQRRRRTVLPWSAATAGAGCLVLLVVLFSWALSDVPWDEIADGSLKPVVVLETTDGKPLVTQGPIQGPYAARQDFPRHLVDAVLTSEDRRFYEHSGIDLRGILRALYRNVGAGEVVQGGSTITQQLIKILYLERDRTWKRKIQEAVVAFWLERKLGKDEILTRYLNNIYL